MGSNSHRIPSAAAATTTTTTTYIHTDPSNFKAIVQHLTGRPSQPPALPYHHFFLPTLLTHQNTHPQMTRPEPDLRYSMNASRAHSYKTRQRVTKPGPGLRFKINGLGGGTRNYNNLFPAMQVASSSEERAIAEKGFYLHPTRSSSVKKGFSDEPRLLPLFPLQAGFAA